MEVEPTLDAAEKSIRQCIVKYNEKFKEELSVEELEELKLKYEKLYKTNREDYLKNFKMYTLIEVVLIIMEALSMDRVKQLSLSNEEIKIAAQELYEHWV